MEEVVEQKVEEQKIDPEKIVEFRYGIPGFEDLKSFIIDDIAGYPPFKMLQSLEAPDVAMIILDAKMLNVFDFMKVPSAEWRKLEIEDSNDVDMYVILRVEHETQTFTANTKAPLVINTQKKIGNQVILDSKELNSKIPIKQVLD